jgi:hypothetical protein
VVAVACRHGTLAGEKLVCSTQSNNSGRRGRASLAQERFAVHWRSEMTGNKIRVLTP